MVCLTHFQLKKPEVQRRLNKLSQFEIFSHFCQYFDPAGVRGFTPPVYFLPRTPPGYDPARFYPTPHPAGGFHSAPRRGKGGVTLQTKFMVSIFAPKVADFFFIS
jgi:hypothetical protein